MSHEGKQTGFYDLQSSEQHNWELDVRCQVSTPGIGPFCDLIGNTWKLLTKSIVCLFSRFCCFVWSNVSFETKAALTD